MVSILSSKSSSSFKMRWSALLSVPAVYWFKIQASKPSDKELLSNWNYTTSLFHNTEIVLSFPCSDLTVLMQRAFICEMELFSRGPRAYKALWPLQKGMCLWPSNPPSWFIQMLTHLFSEAPGYFCIPFNKNSIESTYTKSRQDQGFHSTTFA